MAKLGIRCEVSSSSWISIYFGLASPKPALARGRLGFRVEGVQIESLPGDPKTYRFQGFTL